MSYTIIDRRLNPGQKSLENKQRFMRRQHDMIKKLVADALPGRKIGDESGQTIFIPTTAEPRLRRDTTGGSRGQVIPGNMPASQEERKRRVARGGRPEGYIAGDTIPRSKQSGGGIVGGSGQGDGNVPIVLSNEEFMQLLYEDMNLPDMAKRSLPLYIEQTRIKRAGYSRTGNPSNLAIPQTATNALARRIALKRPSQAALDAAAAEILKQAEACDDVALEQARQAHQEIVKRRASIPHIDPIDIKYRRFEAQPEPVARAVMFCLLDVSGSMDEHKRDLARRFYTLLFHFLRRRYKKVDLVFIRHTETAREVDEDTFMNGTDTGGTAVSSALEEMQKIVKERYRSSDWNIYAAQASDGDNIRSDLERSLKAMNDPQNGLLQLCQYFAYLETQPARTPHSANAVPETTLWKAFKTLPAAGNFAMARAHDKTEIYPVLRDLFGPKAAVRKSAPMAFPA